MTVKRREMFFQDPWELISFEGQTAECDALAARLEKAEAEIARFNAESRQRQARLAEAEALLWNTRPYVYGLDRIKAIDAFLADSASHRENDAHG